MFSWFGKKEAMETISGIGGWIDEQQLTKEEQIKWKIAFLGKMEPFKIVQRIIVSIVFGHWAIWGFNVFVAIWVSHFTENETAYLALIVYAKLEMVWAPTIAATTLYLGGGLAFFKGGKK